MAGNVPGVQGKALSIPQGQGRFAGWRPQLGRAFTVAARGKSHGILICEKKSKPSAMQGQRENAELRALRWHLIAVSKDGNLPYQRQ
ncbi:MAG: hypothetical protein K6E40_11435 [Desulfovibrio sp.]|nr:hypothetical protein [Desulfovibrio sp.]